MSRGQSRRKAKRVEPKAQLEFCLKVKVKLKKCGLCLSREELRKLGMLGNCFFPLFSISKNNFLFLKLKNLFNNPKWTENKNCSQYSICERI